MTTDIINPEVGLSTPEELAMSVGAKSCLGELATKFAKNLVEPVEITKSIDLYGEYIKDLPIAEIQAFASVVEYGRAGVDTRTPEQLIGHALRVRSLVEAFAGDKVPGMVYIASILHDIFDRNLNTDSRKSTETTRSRTKEALQFFSKEARLKRKQRRYIYAIAKDMAKIEVASGEHRKNVAGLAQNEVEMSEEDAPDRPGIKQMISDKYEGEIPPTVWGTIEPYLDIESMEKLLKRTNLEAVIIKACELLDNLRHPSSTRESALLQDVLEAESFYAPIMGVLKLDGLASALRSEASKIRLIKMGRQDLVDEAKGILADIEGLGDERASGVEKVLHAALGGSKMIVVPSVKEDKFSKHAPAGGRQKPERALPSQIGDIMLDYGDDQPHGHYRVKADGALAWKMIDPDKTIMDVVAATVESPGIEKLAERFALFVSDRIKLDSQYNPGLDLADQKFTFTKSSERKRSAIYIAGSARFVEAVKESLVANGVPEEYCDFRKESGGQREEKGYKGLEVAKATFKVHIEGKEIPTEIQFVTKKERGRMRRGIISHILYDYRKQRKQFGEKLDTEEARRKARADNKKLVKLINNMSRRIDNLNPDSLSINARTKPTKDDLAIMKDILPIAA